MVLSALALTFSVQAQEGTQEEPTDSGTVDLVELTLDQLLQAQAIPLNVMGSHIHAKGEWMVGYHFHTMDMDGNRNGRRRLTPEDVHESFPVTPTNMTMDMHMFELMGGITDRVTFMVMVNYERREMDHLTRTGREFTTVSEGIGDTQVMAHIVLARRGRHWWIFTPGLSLPSGSINAKDDTPMGSDQQLPYPMQLGSGSVDGIPMLNYIYQAQNWLTGFHARGRYSFGENDRGYKVGDRHEFSLFLERRLNDAVSLSWRVRGRDAANYGGADLALNQSLVPTADPSLRGGQRMDVFMGLDLYIGQGGAAGNRFLIEAGVPVFQDLDGPQLETDFMLTVAWQWTF